MANRSSPCSRPVSSFSSLIPFDMLKSATSRGSAAPIAAAALTIPEPQSMSKGDAATACQREGRPATAPCSMSSSNRGNGSPRGRRTERSKPPPRRGRRIRRCAAMRICGRPCYTFLVRVTFGTARSFACAAACAPRGGEVAIELFRPGGNAPRGRAPCRARRRRAIASLASARPAPGPRAFRASPASRGWRAGCGSPWRRARFAR